MRSRQHWIGAGIALALSGCSFLVDFDELKRGARADAGGGIEAGTAGASDGSAADVLQPPIDAGPVCPETCDDDDPCTDDSCQAGRCVNTPVGRLVDDDFEFVEAAASFHKTSLISSADQFYVAAFLENASNRDDLLFLRFGPDSTDVEGMISASDLTSVTNLSGRAGSPAALVYNTQADELQAFFAVAKIGGPQMYRVDFDPDLGEKRLIALSTDANYRRILKKSLGPTAIRPPGGETTAIWWGEGGIYHQSGDTPLVTMAPPTIEDTAIAGGLGALHIEGKPAVVWATDALFNTATNPGGVSVKGALLEQPGNPFVLNQCERDQNYIPTSVRIEEIIPTVWSVQFSKQFGLEYITEGAIALCGGDALQQNPLCVIDKPCDADNVLVTVRNPASAFYHRPGDPESVVFAVLVLPTVEITEASITLLPLRFDIGATDAGAVTTVGDPIVLATGPSNTGPDLPEVAFMAPDRVAVSWLERGELGDELHVERYQVCFPPE